MKRITIFLYGTLSYVACLATFLYLAGFIGNFAVPKSMNSPAEGPWQTALLIDLGLLLVFALQHSVMARPAFKNLLTRVIPPAAERSTYVMASNLALMLLFWKWRSLGGTVGPSKTVWERRYSTRGTRSAGRSCYSPLS
jgi:protein-S-isoprenylcysteine O-methyltransferase Ste14